MAPTTPTPTPSPLDGIDGANGTSPNVLDGILGDIASNADPNAPYGANLDAALDGVSRTLFGVDYIPSTGVVITMSPWVIAATAVVGVLIAAVIVARRRVRSSDEPSARARFIERERIERERQAAARVAAAKSAAADGAES